MSEKSLTDWLLWLEQQHPVSIDLGLDRVASVAERLGLNSLSSKIITVAGTNGKGSFVVSLAAVLQAHGYSTACYTSPHLLRFNERVVINQQPVSDAELLTAFEQVEAARATVSLTYFEFTTLAALLIFRAQAPDIVILEVGLGGRLDAVNILAPDIAVITSIDLDHQDYLGDTRQLIAAEKAGILRESTPLVCAEQDLLQLLPDLDNGRSVALIQREFSVDYQPDGWSFAGADLTLEQMPDTGLSVSSQAAAVVVARQLLGESLSPVLTKQALQQASLPGRFQRIVNEEGICTVLDVAHNPQAAGLLHRRLQTMPLPVGGRRMAVFHALQDKDVGAIIGPLKDDMDAWFIGGLDHPRATPVTKLADQLHDAGCQRVSTSKNIRQAFARALSLCRAGDQIIAFGSFFVVAELLPRVSR